MAKDDRLIGCCGLVCSECQAYLATQANDAEALKRVAAQWREEYNAPQLTVEEVICDGCTGGGRLCGHAPHCEVRTCAMERGLQNCAWCADYVCERLQGCFDLAPQARRTLEDIRREAGLAS